jgi:hypothetical protein
MGKLEELIRGKASRISPPPSEFPVIGKGAERGKSPSIEEGVEEMQKARREGAAKGEAPAKRPGDVAKRHFEARPTRPAVKVEGKVTRAGAYGNHLEAIRKRAGELGVSTDEVIDKMYDPKTDRLRPGADEGFSVGREGKFVNREQMKSLGGADESGKQRTLESRARKAGMPEYKAAVRAGSTDPKEQYRRKMRVSRLNAGMKAIDKEIKLLERGNTRESPQALRRLESMSRVQPAEYKPQFRQGRIGRIATLIKRRGALKNAGRRGGLLSVAVSPFTTGEALVGVTSQEKNEKLRSIETLFGLPEFSTGRGLSEKEKKERPIWIDPITGAGKI